MGVSCNDSLFMVSFERIPKYLEEILDQMDRAAKKLLSTFFQQRLLSFLSKWSPCLIFSLLTNERHKGTFKDAFLLLDQMQQLRLSKLLFVKEDQACKQGKDAITAKGSRRFLPFHSIFLSLSLPLLLFLSVSLSTKICQQRVYLSSSSAWSTGCVIIFLMFFPRTAELTCWLKLGLDNCQLQGH